MMKKLSILLAITVLVFTSCSKDDDALEVSGNIIGTWEMTDYDYSGATTTTVQGQSITADFVGEALDLDYRITFEENLNILTTDGGFIIRLTTTLSGQTTTQDYNTNQIESINSGTWEIVNNELITTAEGGVEGRYKILELTESSLVLLLDQELDLSQSGATIISRINGKMSFKRE
ncbi:hypothetical protein MHTCC0001_28390 [Flavobacteriaceae bacterium MHTCC 0001]